MTGHDGDVTRTTPTLLALLRRRAGDSVGLVPRPRSRFENDGPGELLVVDEERAVDPASPFMAVPGPAPVAPAARPYAAEGGEDDGVSADAVVAPPPPPPSTAPSLPAASAEDAPAGGAPAPREGAPVPPSRDSAPEPVPAVGGHRAAVQEAALLAPSPRADDVVRTDGETAYPPSHPTVPAPPPVAAAPPVGEARSPTTKTQAQRPRQERIAAPPPTPAATVEVRISRLIVDARPHPPARRPRPVTGGSPVRLPGPDLEAYLADQEAGTS